jgi:hypothetical protein
MRVGFTKSFDSGSTIRHGHETTSDGKFQDHPLKMTAVPIPTNKFQIDIFGKQTRPKINNAPDIRL